MSDEAKTRLKSKSGHAPPRSLDLRTRDATAPPARDMKRFNIFLVDTGWNAPVSKMVRSHLRSLFDIGGYHEHDSLYELCPQQSSVILGTTRSSSAATRRSSSTTSTAAHHAKARGYRGFRLNLGL